MKRQRTDEATRSSEPSSQEKSEIPSKPFHLYPSIFKHEATFDDIVLQVASFIAQHLNRPDAQHIEIEAKLGLLLDKRTGRRISLPIKSEAIVVDDGTCRFESNMTMGQHKHFNQMLNGLVERGYLKYTHRKELDTFYKVNYRKVRVSVDQATGNIIPNGIIEKNRIADLNIHMPGNHLDYRISLNVEYPAQKPSDDQVPQLTRQKDRLSYAQDVCTVDLTQVKSMDGGYRQNDTELMHELEVEFKDTNMLLLEKKKWDEQKPHKFRDLVSTFLYSVRLLSRKSIPHVI